MAGTPSSIMMLLSVTKGRHLHERVEFQYPDIFVDSIPIFHIVQVNHQIFVHARSGI